MHKTEEKKPTFYIPVLPTRLLCPILTFNLDDNSLWQYIYKQNVLLSLLAGDKWNGSSGNGSTPTAGH
jgi:hypothetical protein